MLGASKGRADTGARFLGIASAILLLSGPVPPAHAEGRTVQGVIVRVDAGEGILTVKDGAGVSWSYKADADAGIDLSGMRPGDRVAVTIGRPTPLNMVTSGDLLRKGDRVEKTGY